ncbi:cytochrome c [Paraflavitalea speifideaquila]|uniref:cytochrome c n=1 Tax=Paraflavitalea speifideaquila TaxID=3076558 RepID=UPI0028EB6C88|nr:c-type cytochrome [Paraflavitalea speifideiaquila]
MKKVLIVGSLLAIIIFGCQLPAPVLNSFLSTSRLTSQLFTIDISKDTFLLTPKGAVIKLPAGTLEAAGGNIVQLEIKEAYTMQDIITAGLATQSNGQPLSSGGMIYINAVSENKVKITKAIAISIPTPFIEPGMQLFKGTMNKDSTINWTDPEPLPANPLQAQLGQGKQLFNDLCASCHRIDKDLAAPALAHIMKRLGPYTGEGGIAHPYDFTRNNARILIDDCYYQELYHQWNKIPMNVFPTSPEMSLTTSMDILKMNRTACIYPFPIMGSCGAWIVVRFTMKWQEI